MTASLAELTQRSTAFHFVVESDPAVRSAFFRTTGSARLANTPALAESLGISAQSLFVRCVEEYEPALWEAIQLCLPGAFLSDEDLEMLLRIKRKLAH